MIFGEISLYLGTRNETIAWKTSELRIVCRGRRIKCLFEITIANNKVTEVRSHICFHKYVFGTQIEFVPYSSYGIFTLLFSNRLLTISCSTVLVFTGYKNNSIEGKKNLTVNTKTLLVLFSKIQNVQIQDVSVFIYTVGASSLCYWEELMLLKRELMLLKCQISTNTNKNGFLLPTKCLEGVLKYTY